MRFKEKGFTLVEMSIAIGLIAVLVGVVFRYGSAMLEDAKMNAYVTSVEETFVDINSYLSNNSKEASFYDYCTKASRVNPSSVGRYGLDHNNTYFVLRQDLINDGMMHIIGGQNQPKSIFGNHSEVIFSCGADSGKYRDAIFMVLTEPNRKDCLALGSKMMNKYEMFLAQKSKSSFEDVILSGGIVTGYNKTMGTGVTLEYVCNAVHHLGSNDIGIGFILKHTSN